MLYNSFSTAATEYGNNNEAAAVEAFVNGIQEFPGACCEEVGLILSMERPWLGASVDRIVRKDGQTIGGLEMKCPLSKLGMSVEDASQDSKFFLKKVNGSVRLKTTHKYHDQVQGQFCCCELFLDERLSTTDMEEIEEMENRLYEIEQFIGRTGPSVIDHASRLWPRLHTEHPAMAQKFNDIAKLYKVTKPNVNITEMVDAFFLLGGSISGKYELDEIAHKA
ncbi:hypothetical protein Bbelb_317590 [Branchiostoma belcheri]|nr:hypothetical protein Bbelb_317590 [Branchiostoma belcheri]